MININEAINNLLPVNKQIQSIDDSAHYIENSLSSYYGTEDEKNDIRRNIEHIKIMISKDFIVSALSPEKITSYKDLIHRGESVL